MTWIEKLIAALTGPLVEIVTGLINKWGTKFIIACGAIYAIVYLVLEYLKLEAIKQPVDATWVVVGGVVGIGIIAFGYFYFRAQQEGVVKPEVPNVPVP